MPRLRVAALLAASALLAGAVSATGAAAHLDSDEGHGEQAPRVALIGASSEVVPGDRPLLRHLNRRGYDVMVIDDESALTDLAGADADVAIVSSSVSLGSVDPRLSHTDVPMLFAEAYLFDDFGLTESRSNESPQLHVAIELANTGHPLEAGFTNRPKIYTAPTRLNRGVPSAEAIVVGRQPGFGKTPVLFAYEAGAARSDGNPAPARQVGFPTVYNGWRNQTNPGWTLFDASLTWLLDTPMSTVESVEFLGEVVVASATEFDGTEIGGLSSISYDADAGVYYTISDDQGNRPTGDPVRYYTVEVDISDGSLDDGDVTFVDVTTLLDTGDIPFTPGGLDPEGMVLSGGELFVSSEGNSGADPIIDPFIRRYGLDGTVADELSIPDQYTPNGVDHGVRRNLSFESLNLTPDGHHLVTAGEGALFQDGPASTFDNGSLARILRYDTFTEQPVVEYVYEVEPWAEPSTIFGVNGIVEVLPIDNSGTMLVMERSFSVGGTQGGGTANVVSIYEVSTAGASDVLAEDALVVGGAPIDFTPVSKRLIFEFNDLDIPIDNIEGMTFGPELADGRASLVIVSDNNFSAAQFTQFVVLALDIQPGG